MTGISLSVAAATLDLTLGDITTILADAIVNAANESLPHRVSLDPSLFARHSPLESGVACALSAWWARGRS